MILFPDRDNILRVCIMNGKLDTFFESKWPNRNFVERASLSTQNSLKHFYIKAEDVMCSYELNHHFSHLIG